MADRRWRKALRETTYSRPVAPGTPSSGDIADGSIASVKLGVDITTSGKTLLTSADAAAQKSALGLGDAADANASDFASAAHAHAAADITSGTIATARLGSGTADSTTYLRGDQTYSSLIIENRTSDPGAPASGQLWLRTDL